MQCETINYSVKDADGLPLMVRCEHPATVLVDCEHMRHPNALCKGHALVELRWHGKRDHYRQAFTPIRCPDCGGKAVVVAGQLMCDETPR